MSELLDSDVKSENKNSGVHASPCQVVIKIKVEFQRIRRKMTPAFKTFNKRQTL